MKQKKQDGTLAIIFLLAPVIFAAIAFFILAYQNSKKRKIISIPE